MAWNGGGGGGRGRGGGGGGGGAIAPQPCPDCGSDMWDNSERKRNPRAPDYVCKEMSCRKGVWISNTDRNAQQGAAQATGEPQAQRVLVLDSLLSACYDAAHQILTEKAKAGKIDSFQIGDTIAAASALMAARVGSSPGILKMEKEAAMTAQRKADDERKQREEAERQRAQQAQAPVGQPGYYGGNDDDLPF